MLNQWTRADNYIGTDYSNYYIVLSQHRDSNLLDKSNFEIALEKLGGEEPLNVIVARSIHWAVGWVEDLLIHKDDAKHLAIAQEIVDSLQNYPVLDGRTSFPQLEYNQLLTNIQETVELNTRESRSDS